WGKMIICKVKRITPYAAWCDLEEYPGVEGMIHISEVAGKWVKDIKKFVKVGKQYVAKVVKIDYQKNFVGLSLKRVNKKDEKDKLNEFRKEERAEKILEQAAKDLNKSLDQAYEEVGFVLQEKFDGLFSAFENISKDEKILEKISIGEEWKKALLEVIKKSFKEKEVEIKAEMEIKNFSSDGVERIKKILIDLEKNFGLDIIYLSAPKYMLTIKGKNPKKLEKKMIEALEFVVKETKKSNGMVSYKMIR
ncbi:MAG: S1 RNA-binding domain-containing protein, partial [Candidatus Aenigmatarchaeota archaeon]